MSDLFEELRASQDAVTVWCVEIHFPAFEDLAEKYFYWSTTIDVELPRKSDGAVQIFKKALQDVPKGRHQADRGNDYAEITVTDPNHALYQEIIPYEDLIERCSLIIYKAYDAGAGYFESEVMFVGYLKDFTLNDESSTIQLTCISDMSRSGFYVGNRILTRERCGTEFNRNGLLAPTESLCGWQTAQGGNATFCSKFLNGVDGCKSHLNEHRIVAVPALSTAPVEVIPIGDGSGWIGGDGGGGGSGKCFSQNMFVLMADDSIKAINKIRMDDEHMGFNIFDNDALVPGTVEDVHVHMANEIELALFDHETLIEVTKEHLIYAGDRLFAPVGNLPGNAAMGMDFDKKPLRSSLHAIQTVYEVLTVFGLATSTRNYIITDRHRRFYLFVHNEKDAIEVAYGLV